MGRIKSLHCATRRNQLPGSGTVPGILQVNRISNCRCRIIANIKLRNCWKYHSRSQNLELWRVARICSRTEKVIFEVRIMLIFLQTSLRLTQNLLTFSYEKSHSVQVTLAILWNWQEFRSKIHNTVDLVAHFLTIPR